MKIPRLSKGPMCYTLTEWAYRTCIYQTFLFIFLAVLFFFIPSLQEDANATATAICITIGVLFCIPALFNIVLFVGLVKDNVTILQVWIIYSLVAEVIYTILLVAAAIMSFAISLVANGFILLVVTLIIVGQLFYNTCVIHSIRLQILEKETNQNSELQHQ